MTYKTETAFSDSVNLGSNPSSPATRTADVSGVSCVPSGAEKSEIPEQKRTTYRTKVGTAAPDLFLERDAVISDCGKYRYSLRRTWDREKPNVLYVMLNPSTANAEVDDATIRSCIRLAKELGYGGIEVVNLFAWRATDPSELLQSPAAIGPDNEVWLGHATFRCKDVICAWGAHPMARYRMRSVLELLRFHHSTLFCFGKTKDGAPKHPLYIKSGTPLQTFGVFP